jgi:hypothetical protein
MDVDDEPVDHRSFASDPSNDRPVGDTGVGNESDPEDGPGLLGEASLRCGVNSGVGMCKTNPWFISPGRAEPSALPISMGNVTSGDQGGEGAALYPAAGFKYGPDRFRLLYGWPRSRSATSDPRLRLAAKDDDPNSAEFSGMNDMSDFHLGERGDSLDRSIPSD